MFRQSNFERPLLQPNSGGERGWLLSLVYNKEFGCQNWTRGFCGPKCCKFCNHSPRQTLFMMRASPESRRQILHFVLAPLVLLGEMRYDWGGWLNDAPQRAHEAHDLTAKLDATNYSVVLVCRSQLLSF